VQIVNKEQWEQKTFLEILGHVAQSMVEENDVQYQIASASPKEK